MKRKGVWFEELRRALRKRSSRSDPKRPKKGGGSEAVTVEPDRPKLNQGGAAAALEFDD